jgi:two-component system, NarL family, nitrate/nitrite response regulator NarL
VIDGADGKLVRVVVIDDHHLVAETLRTTLSEQDGVEVVGLAGTGAEGIAVVVDLRPDVVLVDFRLPDMTGADVIRALGVASPTSRCVVLTGSGQDRALLESLDAGALGFVTKHQRFGEVVAALRAAARGEATISPALLGKVLPQLRGGEGGVRLTDRERSVLQHLALGKSNQAIADELFLSINTVRNHVANVLAKLNARTRTEAVSIATRDGLVAPGGEFAE